MKILHVVGARPQFVKLVPIGTAIKDLADHIIVHTGQRYDDSMSDVFFKDLGSPTPTVNLALGSGTHGEQTSQMLAGLEREFERLSLDWVLVYGDTNSTLAAALAAVKLQLPVAHLEARLRSVNRRMPEEHNRVLRITPRIFSSPLRRRRWTVSLVKASAIAPWPLAML